MMAEQEQKMAGNPCPVCGREIFRVEEVDEYKILEDGMDVTADESMETQITEYMCIVSVGERAWIHFHGGNE